MKGEKGDRMLESYSGSSCPSPRDSLLTGPSARRPTTVTVGCSGALTLKPLLQGRLDSLDIVNSASRGW